MALFNKPSSPTPLQVADPEEGRRIPITREEIAILRDPQSQIAEQFRTLRNSLVALNPEGAPRSVVINEFTIGARGADREGLREVMALIQVVRREGMDTRRMIRPVALSAVLDSRRRGGSIARAFGAR